MTKHVTIVEVGPRDGLQNERAQVSTADKIEFVNRLSAARFPVIEVSAFVSPKWVPQMADAAQVFAGITRSPGTRYTALVPNVEGLERALAARVSEVAIFAASTETFSRKNINQSISESLAIYKDVCRRALEAGLRVRGYLSTAFGCPFEGAVPPQQVADVAARLFALGVFEVAISDTIGIAHPGQVPACRPSISRSIFTTRAEPPWRTSSPLCPSASPRSMRRPAALAAARTPRAQPATWPPTISFICWMDWASKPASRCRH
jgi:hydroxymethylglutaryl-CoA lyase